MGQREFDLWARCTDPHWWSPLFDVLIRFIMLHRLVLWAVQAILPCTDFPLRWVQPGGIWSCPHCRLRGKCPSSPTSFPCAVLALGLTHFVVRVFYSPGCLEFMGCGHRAVSKCFHEERPSDIEEVCEILKLMNSWWKEESAGPRFWNLNFPAPLGPQS